MAFTFKHGDRPLDGYTVQRGVGRGGFGEVYYAVSDGGKEVALKYLRDSPQIELRGVEHCMNLKSPHLVTVYDVRKNDAGDYFIVMEYIAGPSLRDLLIAEPNGLGVQKAAYFLREIARGLGYLHDRGIVHRDLKPGNIFYEDGYVKIGDYGLSKFIAVSQHSVQTASVGTVHYMAPEVGSGNYGKGVDVYALGVILYEMLLGRVPFEGSSMGEVLMKHLTAQPEVDALPAPFGDVIRKALAKDPKDRFQSVDEMTEAVFGVEDIRASVARFEPTSVSMAAARAVPQFARAGVGGSSGEVRLPGSGPAAAGDSAPGRSGEADGEAWWAERHERQRLKRERIASRLDEINDHLRAIERVPYGAPPRFARRSRFTAGLLGLFLGGLGVHRFYLGYTRVGLLQLLLTVVTRGAAALWGMVEGVVILLGLWGRDVYGRSLIGSESAPERADIASRIARTRGNVAWAWHSAEFAPQRERMLFALVVGAGLSAGLGMLLGGPITLGVMFPTIFLLVLAMGVAAVAGTALGSRIRLTAENPWLQRVIVFGLGILGIACTIGLCNKWFSYGLPQPVQMQMSYGQMQSVGGPRRFYSLMFEALGPALIITMGLVNWRRRVVAGAEGKVRFMDAVCAAIVAAVVCAFPDADYLLLAAGIAATASLVVEAVSFPQLVARGARPVPPASGPRPAYGPSPERPADRAWPLREGRDDRRGQGPPVARPLEEPRPAEAEYYGPPVPRETRPNSQRLIWGAVSALLLGLTAASWSVVAAVPMPKDNQVGFVFTGIVFLLLQIVALSKVTAYRRNGAYRDTVRPASIALSLIFLAAGVTNLIVLKNAHGNETGLQIGITIAFLTVSGVMLLFLLAVRGPVEALPIRRSAAERTVWGVIAALLFSGVVMCLVYYGMLTTRQHEEQAMAAGGAIACGAMGIFALSKCTQRRRFGSYRETFRPLVISLCLASIAFSAGWLAHVRLNEEETLLAAAFSVVPGVATLFFLAARGPYLEERRRRAGT